MTKRLNYSAIILVLWACVVDSNVFSVCDDSVLHDDCAKAIFDLEGLTVLLTLPAISFLNTRVITPDQMVQLTQRTRKHESYWLS